MKRHLLIPIVLLTAVSASYGNGLLIPVEPDLPPLAMLNHRVTVTMEDQVAVTKVEQTFRNHTSRELEATYVFPVPRGASVRQFAMWVDGHKMKGEMLKAGRAKEMYTSIVRQTKNPAVLDYIGTDLLKLRVFPIPAQGDKKLEVSFTAVAKKENQLVEYVYPLKIDRAAPSTLEEFSLVVTLKSQQAIGSVYSPSHQIDVVRSDDRNAVVKFEENGAVLDRDFQLFYTTSGRDVGLTALEHRPISEEDGYVMLLVSPRAELSAGQKVPRDIVFVLDTSGSMRQDKKLEQAKKAVRHCLDGLSADDRFGLIGFATTVNRYREQLQAADEEKLKYAKGWVADQYAGGGTAIHEALTAALSMRSDKPGRMFTIVFFTDGQPTIGETDTGKILADLMEKNTEDTRIFSFGVGDDLDAVFLDQIAEKTRAVNRFVRPGEDLEVKVSSFFDKINKPLLANLKLNTTGDVRLAEVYPPRLPDLFHGDQLVVLARYRGAGHATVVLDGNVGMHKKEFVYEIRFAERSDTKPFVEELWARRKVGYLLDQIRINGEKQELVEEVVKLAKAYGITTPYTSYLIMPDAPTQVAAAGGGVPRALAIPGGKSEQKQRRVQEFARDLQKEDGDLAKTRNAYQEQAFAELKEPEEKPKTGRPASAAADRDDKVRKRLWAAKQLKGSLDRAYGNFRGGHLRANQVDRLGVEWAVCTNGLKCQQQLTTNAVRRVNSRRCMEIGGVWIDEGFTEKISVVAIKAQSDAYFRILEKQPQMKEVFGLGNHVVWIAPNGKGLIIDTTDGKEKISDREIASLFAAK
ncbi:MAG: VIT and VWA domain-containing protein [Pirellulales bacterium]